MPKIVISKIKDKNRFPFLAAETPHKTPRGASKPKVALVHATAGSTPEGTLAWFKNPESEVSSDFVIGKDGEIWRPVPYGFYSWHAGRCLFAGAVRSDYNRISYGIELVNKNDGIDPYPEEQIRAMAYVIAWCNLEAPTLGYVRRHADVASPRGRKSDPKGLTISEIFLAIRKYQPAVWLE